MKITYLLTQNLESPSGLGRYWPLAFEMSKRGHTVEVIALHPEYENLEKKAFVRSGVHVTYVAPMHVQKKDHKKKYYSTSKLVRVSLNAALQLTKSALKSQADIIHIAKPHPMNSIAGLMSKYITRSILFLDCDDYEAASGNFSSNWQRNIVANFEKRTPRLTTAVTTNTHFMQNKLHSWGVPDDRIIFLPNGVDRERFNPEHNGDRTDLRAETGLGYRLVISYIGSMSLANHGVDLVIRAFEKVKTVHQDAALLLVGGGEDFDGLVNLAKSTKVMKDIRFVGRVPPQDVPRYYALSDVTVDPVYDNDAARGRPLKLFESWSCGVPFVTSEVGDRKELIGDPPAGLIAKPGDPDSLADTISKLLSSQDLRDELIRTGIERVESYYWDVLADKISQRYQEIHRRFPSK